jgi:hypothetical protein
VRDDKPIEELPEALVEALKAADRPLPMITARVDREVAAMARRHFAARRRAVVPRVAWPAVAASVLAAILILQWPVQRGPARDEIYADVDGSGRIDIADVLALARTKPPGARTEAELDAFARRIVSLSHDLAHDLADDRGDAS